MPRHRICLLAAAIALLASPAWATELTWDIFTDTTKSTYLANGSNVPLAYGDNVGDFDPAGLPYRYGPGGGFTPNVTLDYHWVEKANHANHAAPEFQMWHPSYGDLSHVAYRYNGAMATWAGIIIFTPAPGYQVTLESFDIAGFAGPRAGYDYAVIHDLGLPGEATLWTDASIAPGTGHLTLSPNITVQAGHTLSLYFNADGLLGIDNVRFSQSLVPEPVSGTLALLGAVGAALFIRRRR